jgi:hypothetical protein
MMDLVSSQRIRVVVALLSLVSVATIVWNAFGFPWSGLFGTSLALTAALWMRARSGRSMTQAIGEVDAQPVAAIQGPQRLAMPAPRSTY